MSHLSFPFLKVCLGRSDRGDVQNVTCKSKREKIVCVVSDLHEACNLVATHLVGYQKS